MGTNPKLNKALYNAARNCVAKRFQNDVEEIKAVRDSVTQDMFDRDYTELNDMELVLCIEHLNMMQKNEIPERATPSQLKLLRWYQFNCAYIYANWEQAMFTIEETGEWLSGEALKLFVFQKIEKGERVPSNIFRWMYENWINPTAHKFMLEAELKKSVRNKYNFHYEYLTPLEAAVLINRFGQMYMTLTKLGKFQSLTPELCN